jgi:hypothetical protein
MRHRTRIAIVSAATGFGFAGVLQVAALLATQAGSADLGRVADWPTALLQGLTANRALAVFAGFPLGGAAYSTLAYMVFRRTLKEGS